MTEESKLALRYEEYDAGHYSPRMLRVSELEPDTIVYDPSVDMKRLEYARRHAQSTGRAKVRLSLVVLSYTTTGVTKSA